VSGSTAVEFLAGRCREPATGAVPGTTAAIKAAP